MIINRSVPLMQGSGGTGGLVETIRLSFLFFVAFIRRRHSSRSDARLLVILSLKATKSLLRKASQIYIFLRDLFPVASTEFSTTGGVIVVDEKLFLPAGYIQQCGNGQSDPPTSYSIFSLG